MSKEDNKEQAQPKVPTIVSLFKAHAEKGVKDRKELASKVMADFKSKNVTKNVKGKPLTPERVAAQIGAILYDIKKERKGWWSTYKIEEDEKTGAFKIVKQEA